MPYSETFYPGSWAERAREYVLTRTVPPTDSECDFNWTRLRCEPKCLCGSRLRFGDYTPGRSCRLLHPWERSPDCENVWDPSDEPALRRLGAAAVGTLKAMKRAYDSRVAPPTDPECRFDLETMRCEPRPACHLRFRVSFDSSRRVFREAIPCLARALSLDIEIERWFSSFARYQKPLETSVHCNGNPRMYAPSKCPILCASNLVLF